MGKRKEMRTKKAKNKIPFSPLMQTLVYKISLPIKKEFGQRWLFYLIFLIAISTLFLFLKSELSFPDGIGYFSYTRSLVMDRDLLLANDLKLFNISSDNKYFHPTHNGYISNPFAIGTALLWIPFFISIHIVTLIINLSLSLAKAGFILPSSGNSDLYTLSSCVGSCFFGLLSLLVSFKLARRLFSRESSLLAMLGIWFASPFFFCFYWMANYSHLIDAFAISLFILMWIESQERKKWLWWFGYGISFGFAVLVRWQNLPLGILLLIPSRINRKLIISYLLFFLGVLLAFFPQLIAWKIIYGKFLLIPQGEGFMRWSHPEVLKFLFSPWHGLYSWTPILIFSTIGLFLLYQRDKRMAIGFLAVFFIQVYVNSCVSDWWAGISFGARRLVGISPVFVIGLASFFSICSGRIRFFKYLLLAITSFFAFILTISMLNAPDYLGEYHSYHELLKININTLFDLKKFLPAIFYGHFSKIKDYQIYPSLYFALKIIYLILGIFFFFGLRIGYQLIMKESTWQENTKSPKI